MIKKWSSCDNALVLFSLDASFKYMQDHSRRTVTIVKIWAPFGKLVLNYNLNLFIFCYLTISYILQRDFNWKKEVTETPFSMVSQQSFIYHENELKSVCEVQWQQGKKLRALNSEFQWSKTLNHVCRHSWRTSLGLLDFSRPTDNELVRFLSQLQSSSAEECLRKNWSWICGQDDSVFVGIWRDPEDFWGFVNATSE